MDAGGRRWTLVDADGRRWTLVGAGGRWWTLVDAGDCVLVEAGGPWITSVRPPALTSVHQRSQVITSPQISMGTREASRQQAGSITN